MGLAAHLLDACAARVAHAGAHAAEELPVSFFAVFCVPAESTIGVPFCETDDEGEPLLVGGIRSGNDVAGDPTFQLDIPSDEELEHSFVMVPLQPEALRDMVRQWQSVKAGK